MRKEEIGPLPGPARPVQGRRLGRGGEPWPRAPHKCTHQVPVVTRGVDGVPAQNTRLSAESGARPVSQPSRALYRSQFFSRVSLAETVAPDLIGALRVILAMPSVWTYSRAASFLWL